MGRTQTNRKLAILTPSLGEDVLLLKSFSGSEQMSRLFQYEVELRSEDHEIKFEDVVGEKVCVRLDLPTDETRYFHGYVSRFVQTSPRATLACYEATIVPWLWFLTRKADCRIFQAKTVPEILKQVFEDAGFNDFELNLPGSYRTWDFCVQYRETDFNFVSRLMEQEGIYYFFKHEEDKHTLMLVDSSSAHEAFPGFETILYRPDGQAATELGDITEWMAEKCVQPGRYALNDFNFNTPSSSLLAKQTKSRPHSLAEFEIYDYPGEYTDSGEGDSYAKVRLEELQAQHEEVSGKSRSPGLAPGFTFKLDEHPRDDQNREYLLTSVEYEGRGDDYEANRLNGEGGFFECSFTAIPAAEQFRSPRITPKPVIQGPQTAIVVGPAGEEIYTDADAQVKVQFHWDREGKSDENSSCWIRVSQLWAGKAWGGIHIPRIGQEVIVEFLEGDPDRPIITGRVYNGESGAPYGLPANKTQSGIKSNSSLGGGGSNEIRFEDKKGSEEVYVHAQKDQNNVVENDETTKVGHDRTENVGHDEKITIGNDRTEQVVKNETIAIGVDRTETVGANESITVGADRTRNVGANETVTVALMRTHTVGVNEMINVGAAQEVTVGAVRSLTVGAEQTTTIGMDHTETIGKNHSENIGKNHSASVGENRQTSIGKNDALKVGKVLAIEAGDEITIKTGEASIHMKKDGTITIKGKDITIEGSGAINAKASKDIVMKGKKILQN